MFCNTQRDRKSTRLNSSHANISYAVFCLIKKTTRRQRGDGPRRARAPISPAPPARRSERHSAGRELLRARCGERACSRGVVCFFNDTATTEIYTLSLHDALPI